MRTVERTAIQVEAVNIATAGSSRPDIPWVTGIIVSPVANVVIVASGCAVTAVVVTEPQAVITFVCIYCPDIA